MRKGREPLSMFQDKPCLSWHSQRVFPKSPSAGRTLPRRTWTSSSTASSSFITPPCTHAHAWPHIPQSRGCNYVLFNHPSVCNFSLTTSQNRDWKIKRLIWIWNSLDIHWRNSRATGFWQNKRCSGSSCVVCWRSLGVVWYAAPHITDFCLH